jgi:hypothetical protein
MLIKEAGGLSLLELIALATSVSRVSYLARTGNDDPCISAALKQKIATAARQRCRSLRTSTKVYLCTRCNENAHKATHCPWGVVTSSITQRRGSFLEARFVDGGSHARGGFSR